MFAKNNFRDKKIEENIAQEDAVPQSSSGQRRQNDVFETCKYVCTLYICVCTCICY